MALDRSTTQLPPPRRRRNPFDVVRLMARFACAIFAILGLVPFAVIAIVNSSWAKSWAATASEKLLGEQGIHATYAVRLRAWPLGVELTDIRVDSNDDKGPALEAKRALVLPKIFALLSGKLAIDQIEVDSPHVRAVVKNGKLANVDVKVPDSGSAQGSEPFHAPFNVVAVTDASLDVVVDDAHITAETIDLDVSTDDEFAKGSAVEVAVRAANAVVHRQRLVGDADHPKLAVDDDVLCTLEARVRYEPNAVTVRRMVALGSADLDIRDDTAPSCNLENSDKRKVEIALNNVHVVAPAGNWQKPQIDGRVKLRVPLGLAERLATLPETDGWLSVEGDVRFGADTKIPDVSGHIEAHDIRLGQFNFAHEIEADVLIRGNVVKSNKITVWIADGTATISDVLIEPLVDKIPLRHARLDSRDVNFTSLMRDLGISKHSHVAWDVQEVHTGTISGTISPLQIDGDLTTQTKDFALYGSPADLPGRTRILSVNHAKATSHFAIRPEGLHFINAQVDAGDHHSRAFDGHVLIGFKNAIVVEATADVNIADITPIGPVDMGGQVKGRVHLSGNAARPDVTGDVDGIEDFSIGSLKLGSILKGGKVVVDVQKATLDVSAISAVKGQSVYEVPTARLELGNGNKKGFVMNALANAGRRPAYPFGLRDFLSIFGLETDPRFLQMKADLFATGARLHVALGGDEDKCGTGYVEVRSNVDVANVSLYGETFSDGKVDMELRWADRARGLPGAELDVRSFVLHKAMLTSTTALGTVLGSALLREGGGLSAHVVVDNVPLSRIDSLPASYRNVVDGHVSAVAQVHGMLDELGDKPGISVQAGVEVTPVRVRGVQLAASELSLGLRQDIHPRRPAGTTQCKAPIADVAKPGEESPPLKVSVDGDLFDKRLHIEHVSLTGGKAASIDSGTIVVKSFDPFPFVRIATTDDNPAHAPKPESAARLSGRVSGTLTIDRIPLADLGAARATFTPDEISVVRETDAREGVPGSRLAVAMVPFKVDMKTPYHPPIVARGGRAELRLGSGSSADVAPLRFALSATGGLTSAVELRRAEIGGLEKPDDATIALELGLGQIDLTELTKFFPQIERAHGRVRGDASVSGTLASPTISGKLEIEADNMSIRGLPSSVTDLKATITATSHALHGEASASFGGGAVTLSGDAPLIGFAPSSVDATAAVRNVRLAPADGVAVTADADLTIQLDPSARATGTVLPVIGGEVTLTSLDYARPVSLATDLSALGGRARRTNIETYDPANDSVTFAINVRNRAPLVIRNNLVEAKLTIGEKPIRVTGTNQRPQLDGELRALAGGHLRFQGNDFEIKRAIIGFDPAQQLTPNVDLEATTDYRRVTDTGASAAATGAAYGGSAVGSKGSYWRITLHASGNADDLRIELTSDPTLSQEDIILLLTVGMTRAELDQLQASSLGAAIALNYLGSSTGADRAVRTFIPVIDDFRFGSGYSPRTYKTEPQLTIGKRLADNVRASVTTSLVSEDRDLRSNIEWRLNNRISVQGTYENGSQFTQSSVGNLGIDLRWHLDFE